MTHRHSCATNWKFNDKRYILYIKYLMLELMAHTGAHTHTHIHAHFNNSNIYWAVELRVILYRLLFARSVYFSILIRYFCVCRISRKLSSTDYFAKLSICCWVLYRRRVQSNAIAFQRPTSRIVMTDQRNKKTQILIWKRTNLIYRM